MSGFGLLSWGRRPRGNQRIDRFSRWASMGGPTLSLGPPRQEAAHLWRVLVWGALALVAYAVESGLLPHLGLQVARVDISIVFVAFFALHLGAMEGALSAFVAGYLADLYVGGPPGLCRFLAVAAWVAVRTGSSRVHLTPRLAALVFTFAAACVYKAGILAGLALVAEESAGPGTIAWLSVVPQALFTMVFALPIHAGLARLERRTSGDG